MNDDNHNHDIDDSHDDIDFDDIEALLAEFEADDATLVEPPADIWAAIETSITPESAPSPVVHLADRRRPSTWLGAAAAAVVFVVAGALVFVATRSDSNAEPVVASAELAWDAAAFDPLGADAAATARLVGDDSGYTIDLEQARLPELSADGESLELWLIQPDAEDNPAALVSLGTFDADDSTAGATFDVPDGFDPDEYFVVDISVEPNDGDPAHSGRSILRGPLVQA